MTLVASMHESKRSPSSSLKSARRISWLCIMYNNASRKRFSFCNCLANARTSIGDYWIFFNSCAIYRVTSSHAINSAAGSRREPRELRALSRPEARLSSIWSIEESRRLKTCKPGTSAKCRIRVCLRQNSGAQAPPYCNLFPVHGY